MRLVRLFSWLVGAVFAVVVMIAGFLYWRLEQGPIDLAFLEPRILRAIHEADPNLEVDIGATQLVWDRRHRRIELSAAQVRVGGGEQSVAIPRVAFTLRARALLRGRVALESVDLVSPTLRLVRDADGRIAFGVDNGAGEERRGGAVFALPQPDQLRVRELGIRDGDLRVEDRGSGQTWSLDHVEVTVHPRRDRVDFEARADVDLSPLYTAAPAAPGPARVAVEGALEAGGDALALGKISVDVNDVALRGSARAAGLRQARTTFSTQLQLAQLATDSLSLYWPPDRAAPARKWVTSNITGGAVRGLSFALAASSEGGALSVDSLDGALTFDGLNVRFLETMPPVTAVAGDAKVSLAGGEFRVARGRLQDIEVTQATVRLPADRGPRIEIDAAVSGPLPTAIAILDKPPVELTGAIGLKPSAGTLAGRLGLAFPLRDALRLGDLGLTASARLRGVAAARVVGDMSVRDGDLSFAMRGPRIDLEGDARLAEVPLHLEVRETIGTPAARRIEVAADVDGADWKKLGIDAGDMIQGPSAVRALVSTTGGIAIDASADLTRAAVDLPGACLKKARGAPGRARAVIRLADGGIAAIEGAQLVFGGTSINGAATRTGAGGWRTLHSEATLAPPGAGGAPGRLSVDVDGSGKLLVTSPDLGALLRSFGSETGEGGLLTFNGKMALNESGLPLQGKGVVTGFRVRHSPILAHLLQLASIRGLYNALTSQGIHFDRVATTLSQRGGVVTMDKGAARSASVTVTAAGTIDVPVSTLALKGQLIPSYFGVNQGLGRVPILGDLVTGKDAKAVQAIDFVANGSIADPKVSVNTFSSLTPQALQDLFRRLDFY